MNRSRFKELVAFGPGLVHLLASCGPTDLITQTVIGATYGYSLLWTLIIGYGLHFAIAEATSRYVLATGESIVEGFGRFGRPVVVVMAVVIFIRRHFNNLYMVLLLGTSVHLLIPLPTSRSSLIWSVLSFLFAFWVMFRGMYQGVERLFRALLPVLGGSLVLVVILAQPDPHDVARGLLIPSIPVQSGAYSFLLLLMAMAGSSIGSINHLKYPAYVFEKGWRSARDSHKQKVDLLLSVFGQFLFAALIQVAAAATLHGQQVEVRTIEDMAAVFSGPLGDTGRTVLAVGMWVAVFTTYLGSNTGYGLIVADTYERFVHRRITGNTLPRDLVRSRAYRVFLALFCVPPLYVLLTSWQPFWLVIVTSAIFMVLTPLVVAGLLLLTNNRVLMKDRTSGLWSRLALGAAIVVSVYLTYENAIELIGDLL